MAEIVVAAAQFACEWDRNANVARAERLVREAALQGAQLVLLPELFESPYFPKDQLARHFNLAQPFEGHPLLARMSRLASQLGVVLPISFFERSNNAYFNTVAVIDGDGKVLGSYRKSHIPDGPGYQEKFYFNPGDSGFRVWRSTVGPIGVGICWDQWFPEAARSMALMGAQLLLYPSAIGSEPQDPTVDSQPQWRRVMQGHAACNMVPVIAANRIGHEVGESCAVSFYGSSFVADARGEIIASADRMSEGVILASLDLDEAETARASWGLFRDRRPDLYLPMLTLDGYDQGP